MATDTYLLDDKQAAPVIGVQPNTLRNSRHTGTLAGVEPPAYIKLGRTVRYELAELLKWRGQFEVRTCSRGGPKNG